MGTGPRGTVLAMIEFLDFDARRKDKPETIIAGRAAAGECTQSDALNLMVDAV